jgi:hypothetical protein
VPNPDLDAALARLDCAETALEEIIAESERWHDDGWTGAHVAFTALGGRKRKPLPAPAPSSPPPPASEAVREAAENLRVSLDAFRKGFATLPHLAACADTLLAALSTSGAGVIKDSLSTDEVRNAADALRFEMEDTYWVDSIEHFGVRDAVAKLLVVLDAAFLNGVSDERR